MSLVHFGNQKLPLISAGNLKMKFMVNDVGFKVITPPSCYTPSDEKKTSLYNLTNSIIREGATISLNLLVAGMVYARTLRVTCGWLGEVFNVFFEGKQLDGSGH